LPDYHESHFHRKDAKSAKKIEKYNVREKTVETLKERNISCGFP